MENFLPPFLTVDEIGELLRVSRAWVLRATRQGTLAYFLIAGKPRITPEQLFDWLLMMEKTAKYNAKGLSVLGRDGTWSFSTDGWTWVPREKDPQKEIGSENRR
jgi:excisionase family DNA binding protein